MKAEWITFYTLIAGFLFQLYREHRQRKWDVEDRAKIALTLISEAKSVAKKVVDAAAVATVERQQLRQAVDQNTDISTRAFHEANTVNQKLETLGLENNALQRRGQAAAERSELIVDTVVETHEIVKVIEAEVTGDGKTDS